MIQAFRLPELGRAGKHPACSLHSQRPGCVNMLIAGIITSEMRERLNRLGIGKTFLLDDLAHDGEPWAAFLNKVFHYTVRITAATIIIPEEA